MSTTATYPYSVLGDGAKTSLLRASLDWAIDTHTRVLSCDNETARRLAKSLALFTSDLPNALWPVAVDANGAPAQARRHLLAVLDGTTEPTHEGPWAQADALMAALRLHLADASQAVRAAVRREITDVAMAWLDDGVLVGGVLWANSRKPGYLRLVINPLFGDSTLTNGDGATTRRNVFFDGIDLDEMRLLAPDTHPWIEVDCTTMEHHDSFDLLQDLRGFDTCAGSHYGEDPADVIFEESDADGPYLTIALGHLDGYIAAHRPAGLPG